MRFSAYISQTVRCIVSTNDKLTSTSDDGDQAGHEIIIAPRSGI